MAANPRVAVVVPVFNKIDLTVRFLESFKNVTYANHTMIIVDDGSTDGTEKTLRESYPHVVTLKGDGTLWWAGGTNLGVRYALAHGFDYVLTINNDTLVSPDFLMRLVNTARANPDSIVGSRINYLEDPTKVWAVGGIVEWSLGVVFQLRWCGIQEGEMLAAETSPSLVAVLTGCGTLIPAQCFEDAGLYDAENYPQYHADSEFVLRAGQHGYRALVDIDALIWNDAKNTSKVKKGTFRSLFSMRSPYYWRPLVTSHMRYCPREHRFSSLRRQYPSMCPWLGGLADCLLFAKLLARKVTGNYGNNVERPERTEAEHRLSA